MKKTKLLIASLAIFGCLSASAEEFYGTHACWLRENTASFNNSSDNKLEIRMNAEDHFFGLMGFDKFAVPEGMKVESATLRVVTERRKGGDINVYSYCDFNEGATWTSEADNFAKYHTTPIATFMPKGEYNKALTVLDDVISEDNQTIAAWTNEIDVTGYLKGLPKNITRVNFMFTQEESTQQDCLFTHRILTNHGSLQSWISEETDLVAMQPCLIVTFVEDSDTEVLYGSRDCWLRENTASFNNSSDNKLEIRMNAEDHFFALMGFDGFAVPKGMKVKSATLRVVTERRKGGDMNVYGYCDFAEGVKWDTQADNFAKYHTTPIATFMPKGEYNKALTVLDDVISEDNQTIAAWTNEIDVTNYVKSLSAGATSVNFMFTQEVSTSQDCLFSHRILTNHGNLQPWISEETDLDSMQPCLFVTFEEDSRISGSTINVSKDTYVRSDNDNKNGSATNIELKNVSGGSKFVGLLNFEVPREVVSEDYIVTNATLRLVSQMAKGDRNVDVYAYPSDFDEAGACWSTEGTTVESVLTGEPIASFSGQGQNSRFTTDAISDSYLTVESWTNKIDITDYVKTLETTSLNLMIAKQKTHNDSFTFCTKETGTVKLRGAEISSLEEGRDPETYVTINGKNYEIAAVFDEADLVPQLSITFVKRPEAPEHTTDDADLKDKITFTIASEASLYYRHFIYSEPAPDARIARAAQQIEDEDKYVEAVVGDANGHVVSIKDNGDDTKTYTLNTNNLIKSADPEKTNGFEDLKVGEYLNLLTFTKDEYGNNSDVTVLGIVRDQNGNSGTSGVEEVGVESASLPAEYFNLQGIRVVNPSAGNIYIVRRGNTVSKVRF